MGCSHLRSELGTLSVMPAPISPFTDLIASFDWAVANCFTCKCLPLASLFLFWEKVGLSWKARIWQSLCISHLNSPVCDLTDFASPLKSEPVIMSCYVKVDSFYICVWKLVDMSFKVTLVWILTRESWFLKKPAVGAVFRDWGQSTVVSFERHCVLRAVEVFRAVEVHFQFTVVSLQVCNLAVSWVCKPKC